jgi:hypothetical protein
LSHQLESEELCLNCNDPLIARQNWEINDIQANLLYCTKEECQESKPETKTKQATKGPKPHDVGLSLTFKEPVERRHIKNIPDPERVEQFKTYLDNPEMKNKQGFPLYSKIFKDYEIYSPSRGFEVPEMAAAQFPEECDLNGCPTIRACSRVRNHLKNLTKKFNGYLELYSTKFLRDDGKTVRRWHTLKDRVDLDKQMNDLLTMSKNLELSAKKRQRNFESATYEQRMDRVAHLDEFLK